MSVAMKLMYFLTHHHHHDHHVEIYLLQDPLAGVTCQIIRGIVSS